jgi:hypothetical protein
MRWTKAALPLRRPEPRAALGPHVRASPARPPPLPPPCPYPQYTPGSGLNSWLSLQMLSKLRAVQGRLEAAGKPADTEALAKELGVSAARVEGLQELAQQQVRAGARLGGAPTGRGPIPGCALGHAPASMRAARRRAWGRHRGLLRRPLFLDAPK